MRSPRVVLGLATVVLSVAVGCSVPTNEHPVELSGTVPFGLLSTTTTTTTTIPEAVTKQVTMYFLDTSEGSGRLVPVTRSVDVGAGIQEVLANLFTVRPDGSERPDEQGLVSAIPDNATLLSAEVVPEASRVIVDVRGLFGNEGIQGIDLRNALAQIVWTATADPEINEVAFRNNGNPVQALIDDLALAEGAVDRSDYRRDG